MNRQVRILVVEDSQTQAMFLKLFLEQVGYTVSLAQNGRKGLPGLVESLSSDFIAVEVNSFGM